jgi:hypothetical protein
MNYLVSINWVVGKDAQGHQLRSVMHKATVEAELGQKCSEFGYPVSFTGKFVDISDELLDRFINGVGVEVSLYRGEGYMGGEYVFERIEKDGTFILQKAK